jgi:hypothetical protein
MHYKGCARGYLTMSSKLTSHDHQQTQLQEDEAFIKTLYQQFPADEDQQPSEFLDKRIIKAAYQAVAAEPTKTNKKKITWFHSLATAASLTLVISLVVQQQSHILPSVDTSTNLISNGQKDKQISDNEIMTVESVAAFSAAKPMMDNEITHDSYASTQYDKQMVIAQPMMAKKGMIKQQSAQAKSLAPTSLTSTVITLKNQSRKIEKKGVRPAAEIQKINQQEFAVAKRSPPVKVGTVQKLTIAQYQLYTVQNTQLSEEEKIMWSLINAQADSYYITIYLPDNNTVSYRLAKTQFKLNALLLNTQDKHIINKQMLSEIILTNE